jgi:hypothetical protein
VFLSYERDWKYNFGQMSIFPVSSNYDLKPIECLTAVSNNNAHQLLYNLNLIKYDIYFGACGIVVVEALCYKSEGRGFETR